MSTDDKKNDELPGDPQPWKLLSREYLSRKLWYTVRVDKLELPNGTVIQRFGVT